MNSRISPILVLSVVLVGCALEPKRIEAPETRIIVQPAPPSQADQLLSHITAVVTSLEKLAETRTIFTSCAKESSFGSSQLRNSIMPVLASVSLLFVTR